MRFFLFVFLCVANCVCAATNSPKDECYKIDEVMHDPTMKNHEICRLPNNFCTYLSPIKTKGSEDILIMYYRPIPCSQFERFKKIACLSK